MIDRQMRSQFILIHHNCKRFVSIVEALVAVMERCAMTVSESCSLVQNGRCLPGYPIIDRALASDAAADVARTSVPIIPAETG